MMFWRRDDKQWVTLHNTTWLTDGWWNLLWWVETILFFKKKNNKKLTLSKYAEHGPRKYILSFFFFFFYTCWLIICVETVVFLHVNIMTMLVCTVQLPVGHAVLHGIFKVSVELKEVRCTQHTAISPRRERNLPTLCSHSTLVTQAPSDRCIHTHSCSHRKTHGQKPHT